MFKKRLFRLIVTLTLLLVYPFLLSAADAPQQAPSPETAEQPAIITEEQKKRLKEDAARLSEEFATFFEDMSGITSEMTKKLIQRMSHWIKESYPEISAENRRKLEQFIGTLKEQYRNLETLSLEALNNLLNDFSNFIDKMENEEEVTEQTRT